MASSGKSGQGLEGLMEQVMGGMPRPRPPTPADPGARSGACASAAVASEGAGHDSELEDGLLPGVLAHLGGASAPELEDEWGAPVTHGVASQFAWPPAMRDKIDHTRTFLLKGGGF